MLLHPGSRPVPNCPDYVLVRKRGAGAFGEVWHAHGPGGLDVALRFIPLSANGLALELRSLDAVKNIRHPNLVSLFGAWHKDNWLILAMELCDRSLQDLLAEAPYCGLPPKHLLSYMSDAAAGLDALNAKQVQHRDVKPANLLLLNSGLKVADFGLAKALEQTVGSNTGAGTIAYTAPECFKGRLTPQSDQYSLAVTYFHLRAGHLLFKGDQAQVMYGHLELEPDLSALPVAERAVLARALAKEPNKRWPSCSVFANQLIEALRHQRVESKEVLLEVSDEDGSYATRVQLTQIGDRLYRIDGLPWLDDVPWCLWDGCGYGDVVEVGPPAADGDLRFVRMVERSSWKTFGPYNVPANIWMESFEKGKERPVWLRDIMALGGHWEATAGQLFICLPPGLNLDRAPCFEALARLAAAGFMPFGLPRDRTTCAVDGRRRGDS